MENQNKKGIVVNCLWTTVYELPDIFSNMIYELQMLDEVEVLPEIIDSNFYCISIPSSGIGYCLKEFIVLRE